MRQFQRRINAIMSNPEINIPTYEQKKAQIADLNQGKTKELLQRVKEAIEKAQSVRTISVQCRGYPPESVEAVLQELHQKGWSATANDDPRDGRFIVFGDAVRPPRPRP